MKAFPIPVVAFGPGSQEEDESLDYLPMPQGMETFAMPGLPEDADPDQRRAAAVVLRVLLEQMRARPFGAGPYPRIDLSARDPALIRLVNDALGQGEVSALAQRPAPLRVQETAFAGVWRVVRPGYDGIEACAMPAAVAESALALPSNLRELLPAPEGAMNAPAVLRELFDVAAAWQEGDAPHIVNLTLLPMSPADLAYLNAALGPGTTAILSRGYGNCRISSTGVPRVWWVQYFNSMDQLILNTIEVTSMPEVALAAREDYEDSIERLEEYLAAIAED